MGRFTVYSVDPIKGRSFQPYIKCQQGPFQYIFWWKPLWRLPSGHKMLHSHQNDVNRPSTIGQKWKFLWCQLFASNWCCTLTSQLFFSTNFFSPFFICQLSFSTHILDITFTSCADVHTIFTIWQQDVKIGSIDVLRYWPNVDVSLRFEHLLGTIKASDGSQLHLANLWLASINQPMIDNNRFRTK